jgi:hypothetical protein
MMRAADLLRAPAVPPAMAAEVLACDPRSPLTLAVKLWGDDEEPFRNLIVSTTPEAKQWRKMVGKFIRHLKPDNSGRSVFRGWYFPTEMARVEFLKPIMESRFFESQRVGMSASRARRTSTSRAFVNPHGMVWEIQKPKTGRDVSPIFSKIGAKYPQQREVIFPLGSRFALVEQPRQLFLVRGGQRLKVPYLVFEEI